VQVEQIEITALRPNPENPRLNDPAVDAVARSIQAYGFNCPIVTDANLNIAAGHTRLLAARKLGLTAVPVIRVPGLVGSKLTGFSIADNQTATLATWDDPALAKIISQLNLEADFDLSTLGFPDKELTAILDSLKEDKGDEDDVPPVPEEPVSKIGDLYILGDHRLLCGDSTKAEDVARLLAGCVPFIMVTDPPYGVSYDPSWRNVEAAKGNLPYAASRVGPVTNDDRSDWSEAWVLFPGDVIYSWHPAGATSLVHAAALQESGFAIRMQIIWAKSNFPIGRGDYHVRHEPCWYAVRKGKPSRRTDDRTQTTLWEINLDRNVEGGHSTQKPCECMERPIRNHDATEVYDAFLGSGTTMIACERLGRRCYGMEIEPRYVDVCVKRWENYTGKKAVLSN
jgi:DNA modification methylase